MKCSVEDKIQAKQWEKIIYKIHAEKELVSRISEELSKSTIKKPKILIRKLAKDISQMRTSMKQITSRRYVQKVFVLRRIEMKMKP